MSVLNVAITSGRPDTQLELWFEVAGGKHSIAQRLVNFIESLHTGTESAAGTDAPPSLAFSVQGNEVQASGTFELDTVIATDAISINGVSFTAVASGATGNQFNVGADDAETAVNLAASINASVTALVDGYVTASSDDVTVTVTSVAYGLSGNAITIASADSTIVASGARLTGGAADATAQTITF